MKFSTTAANCQFKSCSQRSFTSFHSRIDWWSCVRSRQQSWQLLKKDISTHLRKSHTQIQSNWLVTSLLVCLLAEQGLTCPPAVSCLPWKKSIFVHLHKSNIQARWHPQLWLTLPSAYANKTLFGFILGLHSCCQFQQCHHTVIWGSDHQCKTDASLCLGLGYRVLTTLLELIVQRLAKRDATELHKIWLPWLLSGSTSANWFHTLRMTKICSTGKERQLEMERGRGIKLEMCLLFTSAALVSQF